MICNNSTVLNEAAIGTNCTVEEVSVSYSDTQQLFIVYIQLECNGETVKVNNSTLHNPNAHCIVKKLKCRAAQCYLKQVAPLSVFMT
jgi:CCR4-NOT transcriptional regulation complex NOT5 subunit